MTSAYRMTEYQFKEQKCVEGFVEPSTKRSWKFLEIEDCMDRSSKGYEYLTKLLAAGGSQAFRAWKILPGLKVVRYALAVLVLIAIVIAAYSWWTTPVPQAISQPGTNFLNSLALGLQQLTIKQVVTYLVWTLGSAVGFALLLKLLGWAFGAFVAENTVRVVRWKDTVRRIILVLLVSTVGCIAAVVHLYIFDKRFLSLSSLERVKQKNA